MIDGAPPLDDPRLHVLRARGLAALRRNVAADAEYAAALGLRPDDSNVRLEAHRSAGHSAAARREWGQTATEFSKASDLAPDNVPVLHARAMALLGAGDLDGYRKTCAALLERFEKTADAFIAGDMVHCCVLRGDTLPDPTRLLPPARVASRVFHRSHILGAALYRAGQYDESVQCFEKAARTYRPRAWDWAFLAMAHHRLGHADEASRCLDKAARWIDEANDRTVDDPSDTRPVWGGWHERIEFPLLLREAHELLSDKPNR
jgi:tetratricopeptide (TPR) repeat protein